MKHLTHRQTVRIAGFFFAGAVSLMAQSPVNNQGPAKPELIALNTRPAAYAPAAVSGVPASQAQPVASSKSDSSEAATPAPPVSQVQGADLVKKALAPSTSALAMAQDYGAGSSSKSWFTAGPPALPATVRMDPAFGLSTSQYGVAPAAVQFRFGKK